MAIWKLPDSSFAVPPLQQVLSSTTDDLLSQPPPKPVKGSSQDSFKKPTCGSEMLCVESILSMKWKSESWQILYCLFIKDRFLIFEKSRNQNCRTVVSMIRGWLEGEWLLSACYFSIFNSLAVELNQELQDPGSTLLYDYENYMISKVTSAVQGTGRKGGSVIRGKLSPLKTATETFLSFHLRQCPRHLSLGLRKSIGHVEYYGRRNSTEGWI